MFPLELGEAMVRAFMPSPHDPATWGDAAAVLCDLTGLPPALVQVGSADTIYKSVRKLYEKAQTDGLGATWELDVFPRMPHAFTVLSDVLLPDAKRGIEHIAAFAVRQFNRAIAK
jgi:acetyl esterase/lipase